MYQAKGYGEMEKKQQKTLQKFTKMCFKVGWHCGALLPEHKAHYKPRRTQRNIAIREKNNAGPSAVMNEEIK